MRIPLCLHPLRMLKSSLAIILPVLYACNQPVSNSGNNDSIPVTATAPIAEVPVASEVTGAAERAAPDTNTTVRFPEFTITVEGYADDEQALAGEDTGKDTIHIYPEEIGQFITNTRVIIESDSLSDIQVDFSFRNVPIIMNEGPVCVMNDWKSFVAEWELLPFLNGSYRFRELTEKDMSQFPATDIGEWKARVKQQCGQEYFDIIKDNKAIREGSSDVAIDEMYIRVRARRKSDGSAYVRILQFSIPIGC